MKESFSARALHQAIEALLPDTPLRWVEVPGAGGLSGLFLDEAAASRPLPADRVDAMMERPPFWALLWPSGERLCRLFHDFPALVDGLSITDFGCGCGLVACAAARAGARRCEAIDCDPLALLSVRANAAANRVSVEPLEACGGVEVDLLLLCDFLYDETHLPLFERLQAGASEVLVVDSRLKRLTREGFHLLGESAGKAVPDLDPHRDFGRLRFWYRGARLETWRSALQLSTPVAPGVKQC